MTRVINIGKQAIYIDHITINPGDSHTWLSSETSFSLNRKIIRLRGMGLIQIEESPDPINEPINEPIIIKEEEEVVIEEPKQPKPQRKRNTRKKSQSKGE